MAVLERNLRNQLPKSVIVISDVIKTGISPIRCDNTREMEIDGGKL